MRARLLVASGLAAFLATGSSALAAPPWLPPRDISAPTSQIDRPSIDFGADGVALIGWSEHSNDPGRPFRAPAARFTALFPDGRVEDRARLPAGELALAEVFGRNRTVVLRVRPRDNPVTHTTRIRLVAGFGTTAGPLLARSRRVAEYRATNASSEPTLAVSETGEVAVAWFELDSRRAPPRFVEQRYRLRIAVAQAGRRFRPRTLARLLLPNRDAERVALAFGRRGELLAAYGAARRVGFEVRPFVAMRLRPRAGRPFGRQQRVGPRKEGMNLQAAALPSGRMALVWASQDAGEGTQRPRVVRAALRAPGRRFGAAAVLDPGETGPHAPAHVGLAMAPDGSATTVWSSVRGREPDAQFPVRTATALPGAGFGPVSTLAASGVPGSVGAARDGRTLVTWSTGTFGFARPPDEQTDTFAAVRPAGAPALAPPETISAPAFEDFAPAAAFDPLSGRATAAWPAAVRTPFLSGYEQVRMQLATRDG